MEMIKIRGKEYEVARSIADDCFVATRKNKMFFIRKYEPYSDDGKMLPYQAKKLSNCGINYPKLYGVDKRNGYIVSEYIEGETLMDIVAKEDIKEEVLEQLFKNAYMAKMNKMTLNYEPDKWKIRNGVVYYTYPFFIKYDEKKDLALKCLPLYFNTPELESFLRNKGIFYDKKRIKSTYETNKEMVLVTCKYYK